MLCLPSGETETAAAAVSTGRMYFPPFDRAYLPALSSRSWPSGGSGKISANNEGSIEL